MYVDKHRKNIVYTYQLPDHCGWHYELKIAHKQDAHIQFLFVDTEEKQYVRIMCHFLSMHSAQDSLPGLCEIVLATEQPCRP